MSDNIIPTEKPNFFPFHLIHSEISRVVEQGDLEWELELGVRGPSNQILQLQLL